MYLAVIDQIEKLQQMQQDISSLPQTMLMMLDYLKIWIIVIFVIVVLILILKIVEAGNRFTLMREMKKYYVRENKKAEQEALRQKQLKIRNLNQK